MTDFLIGVIVTVMVGALAVSLLCGFAMADVEDGLEKLLKDQASPGLQPHDDDSPDSLERDNHSPLQPHDDDSPDAATVHDLKRRGLFG